MLIAIGHCKAKGYFKWNPEYTSHDLVFLYTTTFNYWGLFTAKLERGKIWLTLYFQLSALEGHCVWSLIAGVVEACPA